LAKRKDRQYNGQKKGQTIQLPKGRTENTMAKRKDVCPFFWPLYYLSFLLAIVLFVLSFGHCIVCHFFWSLYCLSFLLAIVWPKEITDKTMTKRKDRQYNGQKKGQTIQWPKERTDNTMAKRKDRQYNGQKKAQTIQWPKERTDNTSFGHCIVSPFFWPLYCLSFLLAIVLSVLSFGHCFVCPFFWPLYCLSFLLAIALSVTDNTMAKRKDKQYTGQKKGQTIHWPK
jgi:quinol-cytochrome oxidoreductase complex cytochrome b subunit